MAKVSLFLLLALGVILLSDPTEAIMDKIVDKFTNAFAGAAEMIGGPGAGEKVKQVGDLIKGVIGGGRKREKRAIHSIVSITKANKTDYQKVEMHRSIDSVHGKAGKLEMQKPESTCLIKENEVYFLEEMSKLMTIVLKEISNTIRGKPMKVEMNSDAYNQNRIH
ncbi:uncharacterized protein LOC129749151 [Uranotaenia lowii]|uniref:uncharacterized protein LOC129749151 n=1 Tax=Uranotaenia lowii TaxID=190385 RepID=UPI00247B057A|nr:uncharacterized protein LOC129749151 [Uranotaenia lowii]